MARKDSRRSLAPPDEASCWMGGLLDAAVRAVGREVRRLVREPDALPLVLNLTEVFRRVEQLVHPPVRVTRVDGYKAPGAGKEKGRHRSQKQSATHDTLPRQASSHSPHVG